LIELFKRPYLGNEAVYFVEASVIYVKLYRALQLATCGHMSPIAIFP